MEKQNSEIKALNYFNAIACLLVVLLHTLSYVISNGTPSSCLVLLTYIPWKISGVVVPAFLFCGAVKLALAEERGQMPYGQYLLRRVRKIYLPYVVWCALYYVCLMAIHYVTPDAGEFVRGVLLGTISSQFYYVVIAMQFYLLRPLWRWMLRRVPWFVGIPVALLLTLLSDQLPAVLALAGISFAYADRIVPTYLIFLVLGLYVGKYYSAVRAGLWAGRKAVLGSGVMVLLFVGICYLQYAQVLSAYDTNTLKKCSDVITIGILLLACIRLEEAGARLQRLISHVHEASLFVFMSHCLFLVLAMDKMYQMGVTRIRTFVLGRAIAGFAVPFGLYALWRLVRRWRPGKAG